MKRMVPLLSILVLAGLLVVSATATTRGSKSPPLIGGYYEGKRVTYLLTDVSTKKDAAALSKATGFKVNFVSKLGRVPEGSLAKLYLFTNGVKGPNPFGFQANILDSVPGEAKYSPLWRVYAVTWKDDAAARLLKSEAQVLAALKAGELAIKRTPLVKNSPVVPS